MKLLLVGSTGLVGSHVLAQALNDPRIEKIVTPMRNPTVSNPKQESPVVNFDQLPENADWWKVDAVICTLGTTIKKAGSEAAFEKVDRFYPKRVAEIAKKNGVQTFVIVTAMGASASSLFFYNRVKGNVEQDIDKVNFDSFAIVRPGLIGGDRKDSRLAEAVVKNILNVLNPILPKPLRVNPAEKIASQLLKAAFDSKPGVHIFKSEKLI